ncbi:MAG: SDR family oxidoreductase [Bacteroidota bacterium]
MRKAAFSESGYWALILGGSSGIGLATAQKLAREGMHIFLIHRDRRQELPRIEAACEEMRQTGIKLVRKNMDAIQEEHIQTIVQICQQELGPDDRIRLLLHSIAKGNLKPMVPKEELSSPSLRRQDFQLTIEAMALSLYDWVQALHLQQLFASDARVIGLTSEGNQRAWANYAAVSAAKTSLEAICRSIALEFAPHGIRCNVVQAGVTDTPSLRMIPGSEHLKQLARSRNPYGRLTRPEDVADAIYLLCKQEAAWINGTIIPVDGGEGRM